MRKLILAFYVICISHSILAKSNIVNIRTYRFFTEKEENKYKLEAIFVEQPSADFIEKGTEYKVELYTGSKRISVKKFNYKKYSPLFSSNSKDMLENKNMQSFYKADIYISTNKKPDTVKLFHKNVLLQEVKVTED